MWVSICGPGGQRSGKDATGNHRDARDVLGRGPGRAERREQQRRGGEVASGAGGKSDEGGDCLVKDGADGR